MLRQWIADNLESMTFFASVVAAALGATAFILVSLAWPRVKHLYREFAAKCAVAFFRAVAAGSAIMSKAVPTEPGQSLFEQPWATTTLIAVAGYFFWEFAGAIGDHKHKLAKEKTAEAFQQEVEAANQDRVDAEFQAMRLNWLLTHLRRLVNEKRQRVRRVTQSAAGSRASIQQTRDGLAPEEQIHITLESLASLFHCEAMQTDGSRHSQKFRVGLVAEQNGRLVPLDAFDLATRSHNPFSSYEQHADRYHLETTATPSVALRCVREGRTIIVSDCETEPGFEFFHDRQRNYLRSMVAHPLIEFCLDGVNPVRAALLVDTDCSRFFREEDRQMLELILSEFGTRIDLEYAINGLTASAVTKEGKR